MRTHGDDKLINDLLDEADLCANEGVPELSALLNAAAQRLESLLYASDAKQRRRVTYVCPVCAASLERQE